MPALTDDGASGRVTLSDGGSLDFSIRYSDRARSARLRIGMHEGLVVVVPAKLQRDRVQKIVTSKLGWIEARLAELEKVRHLVPIPLATRPQAFDLPALAESWRVEYQATRRTTVAAITNRPGRIIVYGAIGEIDACQAALRRWLARRALEALPTWLERVALDCRLGPSDISIKNQRTRWGSCARSGRISLNCKLLFLPRDLVRYVMVHELCHLLESNHSSRFWAQVRQMDREADAHHGQMRDAWRLVPAWAQRGTGAVL